MSATSNVQDPAQIVDIVLGIKNNLISIGKYA